jgi:hypothetical protein
MSAMRWNCVSSVACMLRQHILESRERLTIGFRRGRAIDTAKAESTHVHDHRRSERGFGELTD